MKELRIAILFLLVTFCTMVAGASYPLVKNYPRETHYGGSQTWSIARDSMGRMFFGNSNGLLTFDSVDWNIYGVANGSTVRSLYYDDSETVPRLYVGASEEIGYYSTDTATGLPYYTELTHLLPLSALPCKEIWNIFKIDGSNDVWFQADHHIFRYDGTAFTSLPVNDKIMSTAAVGGKIYVATAPGDIYIVEGGNLRKMPGFDCLAGMKVCAILPFNGNVMFVTEYNGLFIYNGQMVSALPTDIDAFLRDSQVFCACCRDNTYAFGTVSRGVAVKNFATGRTTYSNRATGLQNNTVLTSYIDEDGCLWLGLDDGIDVLYVNAPYYSLLGSGSEYGAGYVSKKVGDLLYLGTNQGFYACYESDSPSVTPPALTGIIKGQIWSIDEIEGDIFVSSDGGVYYGHGHDFRAVPGLQGSWTVKALPAAPGYALVSTYDAFHLLHHEAGRWTDLGPVEGYNDRCGSFIIDNMGYIWLAHWLKGIYRLSLDVAQRRFTSSVFYNSEHGFPSNRNIGVTVMDGRLLLMSERGFYRLDNDGSRVRPDSILNSQLGTPTAPRVHLSPTGNMWCVADKRINVLSPRAMGAPVVDSITYSPIAERIIPGFEHFNFVSDSRLIVSMQNGFYDVDLRAGAGPTAGRGVFFRRLTSYGDSSRVCSPEMLADKSIVIPYSLNSQRFEVIAPEYRADNAVTYSFYLQNYDGGWSEYAPISFKEYTKLPEGEYVMRVRARNAFTRQVEENELKFTILAPWYRSTTARIVYIILLLLLIATGYKAVQRIALQSSRKIARRKQEELDALQREAREDSLRKDYEIADLKGRQLEQDIQFKTRELSNITMNVVRKNEILQDISDRLDKLALVKDPAEISRHITRIRALIRENISHDDDWRTFMHNFDAAYGDFTQRLQQRHAGLTPTELRVCCYLIMGLNSKEMARVFNISHRSVEMTRYRLRKKLDLTRETNLTDYLQSIFNSTED